MNLNKTRAVFLAALMLTMTLSQISMDLKQENDVDDILEIDPTGTTQYAPNSNPMSTIQDAVQFGGQVSSSISGYNDFDYNGEYSEQWNESIATGVGGGDGNHWWKTPTVGSKFTLGYDNRRVEQGKGLAIQLRR